MSDAIYRPLRLNRTTASLQEEINAACRTDVGLCLECGKCTGGCSNAHIFDYTPRKIVQLVRLGAETTLLNMDSLWTCVSCQLCLDRCPSGINIPRIMDYLREKAVRQGLPARRPNVELFNRLMLDSIRQTGKVAEAPLMIRFNWASRQYFNSVDLAPRMLLKGKLKPFTVKVRKIDEVRRIFARSVAAKEDRL